MVFDIPSACAWGIILRLNLKISNVNIARLPPVFINPLVINNNYYSPSYYNPVIPDCFLKNLIHIQF